MYARIRIPSAVLALVLLVAAKLAEADGPEKRLTREQKQIVDTVTTIFTAARADDVAKFDSVIVPEFYIYDNGTRFDGDAVMTLIEQLHAAGKRYEWNLTKPDVHISGNTAWIAYVNQGRISDASGTMDQTWLESAFLQKQVGGWKIVFMHSTRVPRAPQ